MHPALRSSLILIAFVAIVPLTGLTGCETHDRRIYSTHKDKNLHTPDPWAPSTTKAADDATSSLGIPPESAPPSDDTGPATAAPPVSQ